MSVTQAIKDSMKGSSVSPMIENDIADHRRLRGCYAAFRGYDVYAGHYGRDVFRAVDADHAYCSNFRHPVSRVVSLYNYFRAYPISTSELGARHTLPLLTAKTCSLEEFVDHESDEVQCYISDTHFRQLTSSAYERDIKASLDEALSFIDGMLFVFVTELADISAAVVTKTMPIEVAIPRINANTSREGMPPDEIGDRLYRKILLRNQRDLALYDYAVATLRRRHAALDPARSRPGAAPASGGRG